jgi:excisionase family DNA binding protein
MHQMMTSDGKAAPEAISYTPEQAAAVTGRSRTRIFKAIKDGELTARKDGKATLLETDELRRWVRSMPIVGRQPVTERWATFQKVPRQTPVPCGAHL